MQPPVSLAHLHKRPTDSLITILLPFGSDPSLRKQYLNFRGHLRVGRLLEDMDMCAGVCAYAHCDDGDEAVEPPVLVTASLDRVDLLNYPLPARTDLQLKGCVTYAGSSSMNVDLDLSTMPTGTEACVPLMQASLTFVARDRENRALGVPQLVCETGAERAAFERGRHAQALRRKARNESLLKIPPTASELALVHELFMEMQRDGHRDAHGALRAPVPRDATRTRPCVFMEDTRLTSTIVAMPQQQNVHGRLFGGFLLREAFEIAWACGWAATGVVPKFLAIDHVAFLSPVEIGKLVRFDAQVDFTDTHSGKLLSVSVSATMQEPGVVSVNTESTRFHFTFYCDEPGRTPRVLPRTYEDAMRYIDADRRRRLGAALAEQRKLDGLHLRARF